MESGKEWKYCKGCFRNVEAKYTICPYCGNKDISFYKQGEQVECMKVESQFREEKTDDLYYRESIRKPNVDAYDDSAIKNPYDTYTKSRKSIDNTYNQDLEGGIPNLDAAGNAGFENEEDLRMFRIENGADIDIDNAKRIETMKKLSEIVGNNANRKQKNKGRDVLVFMVFVTLMYIIAEFNSFYGFYALILLVIIVAIVKRIKQRRKLR